MGSKLKADEAVKRVKDLLTEHKGDREKVAKIIGVTKMTVANWINSKPELKEFKIKWKQPMFPKALPTCEVVSSVVENYLKTIRKTKDYQNADEKGRAEIENRVRRMMME
jgi:hypothetical protein